MKIAFVDVLGLTFDGNTIKNYGLGGSESALCLMAEELVKLGMNVTVFNSCRDSRAKEGTYDGVVYHDLTSLTEPQPRFEPVDIFIGSRSVKPFLNPEFKQLIGPNTHKILWMHDTFCDGDHLVEELVLSKKIDEIFTLSDFHTSYISTCFHGGNRRNFEVLKRKLFMTRNGIKRHIDWVDPTAKDPNLFVYNASVTKGMIPLVKYIWPEVKKKIPAAKLVVIGGYYRFRDNAEPDAQEKMWREMVADPALAPLHIDFTGIIPQQEIASILASASFMIYPAAFPETFGISALESLAYNTPLITTRFGALEETALENACYLQDYAIEPNNLFPNIHAPTRIAEFVKMTIAAHANTYLHAQKKQYCNIVHDICGWDTVALQWKQHLYKVTGLYLPVDEYRKVQQINVRVHQVFGRRFSNPEEWVNVQTKPEQPIVVVVPYYNAEKYIEKCIKSVIVQDYENYKLYLIDDASTDDSLQAVEDVLDSLPENIRGKIFCDRNPTNSGAVYNQIQTIRNRIGDDKTIIMLLDGDDSLVARNDIFQMYNNLYTDAVDFTYGSSWSMADNIPLIAQPYPPKVIKNKTFRQHKFAWNMPYTHLRTFRKSTLEDANNPIFQDEKGEWLRAGGDTSIFYQGIEHAKGIMVVQDIVYNYNDLNPLNDFKVHAEEQTNNANNVLQRTLKAVYTPDLTEAEQLHKEKMERQMTPIPEPLKIKQILLAIPTAKYIESETFKSIFNLEVPEGYKLFFQYFYGYNIDQVRNLIADWATHYDYLFSVDSDIVLPKDALVKLLRADKPIISGVYVQRKEEKQVVELYIENPNGGSLNIPIEMVRPDSGIREIMACGFGCVLVKSEVIRKIGYPQFEYHSALTAEKTVSEDFDFCMKAKRKGFKTFVDPSIICDHIGMHVFRPQYPVTVEIPTIPRFETRPIDKTTRFRELANQRLLPVPAQTYLHKMASTIKPKVIYDIGACVMHWTSVAKEVWPDARYVLFEAMDGPQFLYEEAGIKDYHMGVLSNKDGRVVQFYENEYHPGGNSYYRENTPEVDQYFPESSKKEKISKTLDQVVMERNFPYPDIIKCDTQGAELDILKGANKCLEHCSDLILELQTTEYNVDAPLKGEVIEWLKERGFELVSFFCDAGPDGDYHFQKIKKTL